ncbi:MAG: hypothetical protein BWY87_01661 [Deltaproteobacteria bacterium ADurb.Bin510]|nr:MAG: hypothetical protein BWY87_01661 [Deltaproteobacteria bacterium ADurb.Bin510]
MAPQSTKRRFTHEIIWFLIGAVLVFVAASGGDLAERFHEFVVSHESGELDEIVPVAFYGLLALTIIVARRWREAVAAVKREQELNYRLKLAFDEINQLKGILPICSFCKRIRDDDGQ